MYQSGTTMSTSRLLSSWASTLNIHLSMLVYYRQYISCYMLVYYRVDNTSHVTCWSITDNSSHLIECYMFSSWYWWKKNHFAFNNNHSLSHILYIVYSTKLISSIVHCFCLSFLHFGYTIFVHVCRMKTTVFRINMNIIYR
jgi:hypothetical protein